MKMERRRVKCRSCGKSFDPDTAERPLLESRESEDEPIVVRCPYCREWNRIPPRRPKDEPRS
jgi:DNA-directed RNA polymerase subunit RPC12/RpoP